MAPTRAAAPRWRVCEERRESIVGKVLPNQVLTSVELWMGLVGDQQT